MKDRHHNIPISMGGPDIPENIFWISRGDHEQLHANQKVPYSKIRRYREKTNHIIIPNNHCLDAETDLLLLYFGNATTYLQEQKKSLKKVILYYQKQTRHTVKCNNDDFKSLLKALNKVKLYIIKE